MSLSINSVTFNLARQKETEQTYSGLAGTTAVRYVVGAFATKKNGMPASRAIRRFELDRVVTSDGSSKVGTTSFSLTFESNDACGVQDFDAVKAYLMARVNDAAFWTALKAQTIEDVVTP